MRRRITLIMILMTCFILIFTISSYKESSEIQEDGGAVVTEAEDLTGPDEQDNTIPTSTEKPENLEHVKDAINQDIKTINETLAKSATGKNNIMAQLFGLTDILGRIENISSEAMDNGDALSAVIKDSGSKTELLDYQKHIEDYRMKIEDNKSQIKEAKGNQDIDQLKSLLSNLYELIEDYNEYLLEVL